MEQTFQSAYQEEERRLNATIAEIDKQLERLRAIPVYTGHDFTEQVLEAGREEKRQSLAKSLAAPYFGRLDFQEKKDAAPTPLYIGKIGVDHEEVGEQPMVIDWRAPIASVFYSFTGGDEPSFVRSARRDDRRAGVFKAEPRHPEADFGAGVRHV